MSDVSIGADCPTQSYVINISVFWDMTRCAPINCYWRYGGPCCLRIQDYPDYFGGGDSKLFRNVCEDLPICVASYRTALEVLSLCFENLREVNCKLIITAEVSYNVKCDWCGWVEWAIGLAYNEHRSEKIILQWIIYIHMSFNYQIVTLVAVRSARLLSMSLILEYTKEIDMIIARKITFILFSLVCI